MCHLFHGKNWTNFLANDFWKCNWNTKIYAVYGEGAMTDQMCQKWFVKFCAEDFSLDDASRSGKTVEVDSDQTETLIENNQCYTMREIVDLIKNPNQ